MARTSSTNTSIGAPGGGSAVLCVLVISALFSLGRLECVPADQRMLRRACKALPADLEQVLISRLMLARRHAVDFVCKEPDSLHAPDKARGPGRTTGAPPCLRMSALRRKTERRILVRHHIHVGADAGAITQESLGKVPQAVRVATGDYHREPPEHVNESSH